MATYILRRAVTSVGLLVLSSILIFVVLRLLPGGTALGMATPSFVTGIVLIVIFGVKLELLPTQGYVPFGEDPVESMKTVLLPAITLAIAIAAPIVLILRSSLT